MPEKTMTGRLYLHFEQGYEGPPWGFQDNRYIVKDDRSGRESWDYRGMHILGLGDYLKVSDSRNGEVLFEGKLEFRCASEMLNLYWYPKGISKEGWIKLFSEPATRDALFKAELTPAAPWNVQAAVYNLTPGYSLVQINGYKEIIPEEKYSAEVVYQVPGSKKDTFVNIGENNIPTVSYSGWKPVPLSFTYLTRKCVHGKEYCTCKRPKVQEIRLFRECETVYPAGISSRLRKALEYYFPEFPAVESFKRNPFHGLFSFEGMLVFGKGDDKVRIHFYFQDKSVVCGCTYKRDKIGRWRRKVKKEDRFCICGEMPQDVLSSISFTSSM